MYARRLSSSVTELLCPVLINVLAVAYMSRDADALGYSPVIFMDVTHVDDFDVEAFDAVQKALSHARPKRVIVVTPSPVARLGIASSMTGPIELFEDRESGLRAAGL